MLGRTRALTGIAGLCAINGVPVLLVRTVFSRRREPDLSEPSELHHGADEAKRAPAGSLPRKDGGDWQVVIRSAAQTRNRKRSSGSRHLARMPRDRLPISGHRPV